MLGRLRVYGSFVRFSHSVFALPFALVGALLAMRDAPFDWRRVVWIACCMVTARSAAMGFNRVVDARFDARNPRTAAREIPAGRMSSREAWIFVTVSSILFVASAAQLGRACLFLSPVALAIVFWYSLAKRVTSVTQGFLGLAMAVAPVGGWIAAGGGWRPEPAWLGLAIGTWVAGFDVLYACQDVDFDRREGLKSIPVRFGVRHAIVISRALHVVAIGALAAVVLYWGALAIAHRSAYIDARDLSDRVAATMNERPIRVAAMPMIASPFRWSCVAETDRALYRFTVRIGAESLAINPSHLIVDGYQSDSPSGIERYEKPQGKAAERVESASRDRRAQILLGFARFPIARVEADNCIGQTLVQFADVRYTEPGAARGTFSLNVPVECSAP